ncbi:MAG: YitT family protein [Lachnospiraceae bacterium]|nr:YitT family protein [Lachnospiraceae bacterium]
MPKKELAKRYILLILGLYLSALGVAFTKHGELGVSPISSVPNVLSYKFTFFTLGTWLIIWNCILIGGQIIILRKKFQLIQLLQIPLSFLFGYFTDFNLWCVSPIPAESYPVRLLMVFIGIVILGLGISLSVIANVIMNSGEAFVKAVSDTVHKEFGNVKIAFDLCCVISAVILSLFFFDFMIVGTREGTVLSAVFTGVVVKFFNKRLKEPLTGILTSHHRRSI